MTTYGYVNSQYPLPTNDQLKIVADYHCQEIFIEKADSQHRRELRRLLTELVPGDRVVIASLQAFGHTTEETLQVMTELKDKQVQVISWSTQLHLNYYKRTAGLF
ncbi:recombinase family protein [Vagococcus sp. BWB3-3]|uniref:Recombinase family protein n=1 Tax=Vagococcus allomyrinae TaxID=2794353 RepID=A0A940P5P0_9ENTE|nr:recombinase family protein [Vagococcus allomyrinae]MBP1040231.1 recombinase family protein [Vagococcus allomyrinae]